VAVSLPASEDAPLQLQLLSLERHHEQMFCFKAPSLHEKVRAQRPCSITDLRKTTSLTSPLCVQGAVEMSQADDSAAVLASADGDENAARPAAVKATKRRKASKR